MPKRLQQYPVHLGRCASAVSEPRFTGMPWYAEYTARHRSDGSDARLVSMHSFSRDWNSWEMHPDGSEVVICTHGEIVLIQEIDGKQVRTRLRTGEYAINAPGVWHTADIEVESTAVFITAGIGTQLRSRGESDGRS